VVCGKTAIIYKGKKEAYSNFRESVLISKLFKISVFDFSKR
jgi:hypothetical protein